MLQGRRILLIIAGGIAAYKSLELIRRLRERGAAVRCVMTEAARQFVTPLSVASLSEDKVYGELWSLTDESEMGHIRLSREADLLVVAPATADLIARMAAGLADDLAATTLLASDKPVLIAPAMNAMMWAHPATQANLATLKARGVLQVGPGAGELACGEIGYGRMAEPAEILAAITRIPDPGSPACRPARAGHQRSDPRADRPGALPVEPFLGQAGTRDRRRAGRAGGRDRAGLRADAGADPVRGQAGRGRDRAADAGGERGGAAGRCRGHGGGRLRLAGREPRPARS